MCMCHCRPQRGGGQYGSRGKTFAALMSLRVSLGDSWRYDCSSKGVSSASLARLRLCLTSRSKTRRRKKPAERLPCQNKPLACRQKSRSAAWSAIDMAGKERRVPIPSNLDCTSHVGGAPKFSALQKKGQSNGLGKGGYARKTPPGTRRAEGQRANETVARTLAQHLVDLRGIVRAVQGSELFGADRWCVQTHTGDTD